MADRLKTFTEEEKRLAEKNHDLVYQFLRAHNYSMEDYYNIVVFGYLKGIQKYCRYVGNNTENNLDGICWNCMRSEMKSHFKMETAKKRQPTEIIMTKVSSAEDEVIALEIMHAMQLFCLGNWGRMSEEDKEMNELALKDGGRLMGTYKTCKGKVWIITEADRSVTTVLFPREY